MVDDETSANQHKYLEIGCASGALANRPCRKAALKGAFANGIASELQKTLLKRTASCETSRPVRHGISSVAGPVDLLVRGLGVEPLPRRA